MLILLPPETPEEKSGRILLGLLINMVLVTSYAGAAP